MTDSAPERPELPLWKKALFALITIGLFFGLLEGLLALAGFEPTLAREDPFFGFASNVPLFIEGTDAEGREILLTAPNKIGPFNEQQFPRQKAQKTYRIFCLGGSTTYGRPYDDTTSFAGWLRALLPVADSSRHWEVVNAGGISYASYRVAALMEELARYDPDLFIVYTGHNEFLEERTYGSLRDTPEAVKTTVGLLARTHTWAAMSRLLTGPKPQTAAESGERNLLPERVDARLDRSAGLDLYERDDELRDKIVAHYRISLERMVEIAAAAGAELIFVTPASNLKDCSPFKSQHTDGLASGDRERSAALLATARQEIGDSHWDDALAVLDEAVALDPRYAELHYLRGRALFALGRHGDAKTSFERALEEDVCPLRALPPLGQALGDVARATDTGLVDFVGLLGDRLELTEGHDIPGEEYYLDHVHPTIEGYRLLAVALVDKLAERGIVNPVAGWGEEAIAQVAAEVESTVDVATQSRALAHLAHVLNWAGKKEDSLRLAMRAVDSGLEDSMSLAMIARHYATEGDLEKAREYYRRSLRANPRNPNTHYQFSLLFTGQRRLERAAAHLLMASAIWPDNQRYRQHLSAIGVAPGKLSVTRYPSGAFQRVAQAKAKASGGFQPHGLWTEWYEQGTPARYVEYRNGQRHGVELAWDEEGRPVSQGRWENGTRVEVSTPAATASAPRR